MKHGTLLTLALLTFACASSETPATSTATFFHGMTLISGDGAAPIENAALVVDEGAVVAVGGSDVVTRPAGAESIDLSGRTIMPLLHSVHVHLGYLTNDGMAAENYSRESIVADLERHAHYGIGSVLALGTDAGDTAFEIREDQRAGRLGGARLFTVGRGITSVGGWPSTIAAIAAAPQQVATQEEARAAVQAMADKDADAIKIWVDDGGGSLPKISRELFGAAIDEASQHGLDVHAHVYYLEDAKALVTAGVSGLAHSIRDADVDDELIEMMLANDVVYVPTLVAHQSSSAYADQEEWIGEASMRETVDAAVIDALTSSDYVDSLRSNPALAAQREEYATALRNLEKLNDAGVRIALGTDSGTTTRFPGYFEHRELALMVDAGMTPEEALTAGTRNSAEVLGLTGTLSEGAPADFMVLASNPLDDINNTRNIEDVFVGGQRLSR
jgi:imidazolonepropionase-like amidohydrolase